VFAGGLLKNFRVPQRQESRFDLQRCARYNMSMSEQEVLDFYKELEEHYGVNLANFEHHPKQFANQVKVYRYYKEKQNESSSVQ
jgi:hypothetical protein